MHSNYRTVAAANPDRPTGYGRAVELAGWNPSLAQTHPEHHRFVVQTPGMPELEQVARAAALETVAIDA